MKLNRSQRIYILVLLVGIIVAAPVYYFTIYKSYTGTTVSDQALYLSYNSAQQLIDDADFILVGSPTQNFNQRKHVVKTFDDGTIYDYYTLTDVKIDKVLKGSGKPGEIIQLGEPISYTQTLTGKVKITRNDYTELKKNSKYVIFLKSNTFGFYFIMTAEQGKYNIDHTDLEDLSAKDEQKQIIRSQLAKDATFQDYVK